MWINKVGEETEERREKVMPNVIYVFQDGRWSGDAKVDKLEEHPVLSEIFMRVK